jgi:hypothetical protein
MNLEILEVLDRGNLEKERIAFRSVADLDIGQYAIFCAYRNEGGVTAFVPTSYWFPDHPVKAGDSLLVYTKLGDNRFATEDGPDRVHHLFWNRSRALWGENNYVPVLILIAEWKPLLLPPMTATEVAPSGSATPQRV